MKIRLHLVRFMYINLILSCCFWLYDIAAAADVAATNTATVHNAKEKIQQTGPLMPGPVANEEDFFINPLRNVKNDVHFPTEKAPAATAQTTAAAPKMSSSTSLRPDADNMMKVGTEPSTDTETINAPVTDTSVNMNVLPSDVNFNNNNYFSVVPNSEKNNNAENEVTANVPKNQLNKQNDNMYITNNVDVNQLDKSQTTNLVDNVVRPISAKEKQQQNQGQQAARLPDNKY
ncbi:PREDICTED: homeobox protein 6-like [Drosophila arizonae]|uniref:Homeobox protein 6-like n=1 Tax=Drosophila arizonae TaxID=7263 RepID=A0ABM1NPL4_DROAR|nr:PREDICTED: homeobox protein 6-like [Drosophila arizonae]